MVPFPSHPMSRECGAAVPFLSHPMSPYTCLLTCMVCLQVGLLPRRLRVVLRPRHRTVLPCHHPCRLQYFHTTLGDTRCWCSKDDNAGNIISGVDDTGRVGYSEC